MGVDIDLEDGVVDQHEFAIDDDVKEPAAEDQKHCKSNLQHDDNEALVIDEAALEDLRGKQDEALFTKYDKNKDGSLGLEEYKKLLKDEWHGASDPEAPAHQPPWSQQDREEIYKMQDHYMAEDANKDALISRQEFAAMSMQLARQRTIGHRWPATVHMASYSDDAVASKDARSVHDLDFPS